ncbi:MAG: ABC transporter ATP-binding protein [Magnetovibrionaceae bacterium]
MALLEISEIRHRFDGPEVVKGVSLDLDSGEFLCLLGPSGCGKTTLLRLAAGLERVQTGSVRLGGRIVGDGNGAHVEPEGRRVGLMFQDFALFPHLTIRENIRFGVTDLSAERRAWIDKTVARMGIEGLMDNYPHTLSGGQQQRAALVRALAPGPQALLLDEPFSGLDVTRRAAVREETLTLVQDTGIATLMVTHDPEEAMFMADRILVMDEGRIVQAGSPAETYFKPANAYVATLFGPVNRLSGTVEDGAVETALGSFPASNLTAGDQAEVMIRPEGIEVTIGQSAPTIDVPAREAEVVNARLLGNGSHLRLRLPNGSAEGLDLQARIPGAFLPERGAKVMIRVVPDRAFVFPG